MTYIAKTTIHGAAGCKIEAGSPISLADMPRLGYDYDPERAWRSMLEDGDVELQSPPATRARPDCPGGLAPMVMGGPTRSWRAPDPDRDLRAALEASAAFDRRQAERAASPAAVAPARRLVPGREWVRR